jgi:hypothetical protein
MDRDTQATHKPHLIQGEFAPVYWEPLGRRGERLVVGLLLTSPHGLARAHVTLHHKRLLDFISQGKTESAYGIIHFAFNHFNKTLEAGGMIGDLRAPFANMSIGRTEAISGRSEVELLERATRICTLIGRMPSQPETNADATVHRTLSFVRDVRHYVKLIDKKLAKLAMKADQFYPVGGSELRVHFHYERHFAQFCSLPLPNARVEAATECQARLADLVLIRSVNSNADVALCINTATLKRAANYDGKTNATHTVHQRTMDFARAMKIPVNEYDDPMKAAGFLRQMAKA